MASFAKLFSKSSWTNTGESASIHTCAFLPQPTWEEVVLLLYHNRMAPSFLFGLVGLIGKHSGFGLAELKLKQPSLVYVRRVPI